MSTLDSFLDLSALRADLPDVYSSLKPSPDFTSLLPPELKLKIIEELANELHEQSIKAYDDPHALETRCAPLDFSEAATFARADVKVASVLLAARSLRDNTGERLFSEAEAAFLAEELLLDDCYYNKLGNYTIRLVARYKSKIYPPGVKVSLNPSGHEAFDRKVRLLGKELQRNEGCALALQCTHHLHFTEARFSNLRHSAAHLTVHNAEIKKHYSLTNLQLGGPVSVALKMTALALQAHEETIPVSESELLAEWEEQEELRKELARVRENEGEDSEEDQEVSSPTFSPRSHRVPDALCFLLPAFCFSLSAFPFLLLLCD